MKKASKVFHILAGVIGVFLIIASILALFACMVFLIAGIVAGIFMIIYRSFNANFIIPTCIYSGIGIIVGTITLIILLIAFIGTVLAFVGLLNKKVTNIINIVFGVLVLIAPILYFLFALWNALCFINPGYLILVVILLVTPIGWMCISPILVFLNGLLFFILSILAGVFGLLSNKKKKQQPEEIVVEEATEVVDGGEY